MKNGGSNSSNPRIMMKFENQNQRKKLLRIAKMLLQEAERWNKFLLSPDFVRIGHVDEMLVSEYRGWQFEPQHQYFESLSKTLYMHCLIVTTY